MGFAISRTGIWFVQIRKESRVEYWWRGPEFNTDPSCDGDNEMKKHKIPSISCRQLKVRWSCQLYGDNDAFALTIDVEYYSMSNILWPNNLSGGTILSSLSPELMEGEKDNTKNIKSYFWRLATQKGRTHVTQQKS